MKSSLKQLSFHPFGKADQKLALEWLEKPHVKKWYHGQGLMNTINHLDLYAKGVRTNGNYHFDFWVAYLGKDPFGLLMTSPIEGPCNLQDPYNKWFEEGKEIITLDVLIGEERFLGKGLGQRMIRELLLDKFSRCNKVLIDPSTNNIKAIHIYEKVGFKKIEEFCPDYDPTPHWMMHLDMEYLRKEEQ